MSESGPTPRRKRSSSPAKVKSRAAGLTEQDVLDAALSFVQAKGVEALSMRGLAKQLGVTPMALYHYVPNKAALLDRLAESMLATVATPEPSSESWDAQLRAYALAVWERIEAYPGLSRVALERPPMKASGRLSMYLLSVLRAAGFDARSALLGSLAFHIFLAAVVSGQVRDPRSRRKAGSKAVRQRAKLPPETQQFVALLGQIDGRALMEFGLDTVIAGLRAERERRVGSARGAEPEPPAVRSRSGVQGLTP